MKTLETSRCPLVQKINGPRLPRFNGAALATVLAFGFGLMAAAISSGPF